MATSICSQEEYIIPDTAVVGDVLVLTKPLGTGATDISGVYTNDNNISF